ncbi:DUF1192 domain-containing protein [Rhizobium sp. EC-SD404]|uniref:DUF1192 domain-containing protein n=1 Tax=Rhizobium sp. EC-SD404 TaxID=2038389 RepID=UPI0012571599|nr:DUF1192 domain-containing protein [Rhizobium sp. EC-SD404]VVT06239.1 conserved hypothetical protein [Rhizobium sp. EC-SD404]
MAIFDDVPPTRKPVHEIGIDLSLLSADELRQRIEALRTEIARLEEEIETKTSSKAAAEQFFR